MYASCGRAPSLYRTVYVEARGQEPHTLQTAAGSLSAEHQPDRRRIWEQVHPGILNAIERKRDRQESIATVTTTVPYYCRIVHDGGYSL